MPSDGYEEGIIIPFQFLEIFFSNEYRSRFSCYILLVYVKSTFVVFSCLRLLKMNGPLHKRIIS